MRRSRFTMSLVALMFIIVVILGVVGNAASSTAHWPGFLDVIRRYPWPALGVVVGLGLLVAIGERRLQNRPVVTAADLPPPPAPVVPGWVIPRAETEKVIAAVRAPHGRTTVGVTTAVHGAGGFGKTTLAQSVCADRRVRRHFRGRVYLVTIGRDLRSRPAIAAKVCEVAKFITGDTAAFTDPHLAGGHLGRLLNQRRATLLVLDDVWEAEQLAPFLVGGTKCVRLITTRVPSLLPSGSQQVLVDQMTPVQARKVLTQDLPPLAEGVMHELLQAAGGWPLLLRLINRLVAADVASGANPTRVAAEVLRRLREHGPATFDNPSVPLELDDPDQRRRAVRATLEAAIDRLPIDDVTRFTELGAFAEDEALPIPLIAKLWQRTGSLTDVQALDICRRLDSLSLVTLSLADGGSVILHDVIRDYLRHELGPLRLALINEALTDAVGETLPPATSLTPGGRQQPGSAWWELPDGYFRDHAIAHMVAAGRVLQAEAVASDIRWIESRLEQRGFTAPWRDLADIPTSAASERARDLARAAHLLTPTVPPNAVLNVLHSRLKPLPAWREQITLRQSLVATPALIDQWTPPDLPDDALERSFVGHTGWVNAVAISADGTWLATASADRSVRIWDRTTSATAILTGHTSWVNALAISPDGTWLATAGVDGSVRIWNRSTGTTTATLTGRTRWGRVSRTNVLAIAPDGTWVVTAGDDRLVRIWDHTTGSIIKRIRTKGRWSRAMSVAISPDGTWLATTSGDGSVRIWDLATKTAAILTGRARSYGAVAISPDGTWLAATGLDGSVWIWDRSAGAITATLPGQIRLSALAISPDGAWLATAGADRLVRIWDRARGATTATLATGPVSAVAISPDGTWLATAGEGVRIWDRTVATVAGRADSINTLAVSPDGTWLATADDDRLVHVRDRANGVITDTLVGHTGRVNAIAISPDGTWIATASIDASVGIWDPGTGTTIAVLGEGEHLQPVNAVAIAPDGTWLVSAGEYGEVLIWDLSTYTATDILAKHIYSVNAVAIAPDGTWLVTAGEYGEVLIWDLATCTATATDFDTRHTGTVNAVAIAPDGTWFATADENGEVRIWDPSTGAATATLTGQTVAISPDGVWLATTGEYGETRILDRTSREAVTMMRADASLRACAWTPDGRNLVVGGSRGVYMYEFRQ